MKDEEQFELKVVIMEIKAPRGSMRLLELPSTNLYDGWVRKLENIQVKAIRAFMEQHRDDYNDR